MRWALPLIAEADRVANGQWTRVALDARAADDLWLPPHAGEPCHGDALWIGSETPDLRGPMPASWPGLRLHEAAAWLRRHEARYASGNPSCWSRIVAARDGPWGPVVLAPFAVGDRTGPPTALIVIDGLHRVLGWSIRHTARVTDEGETLPAFLAGPPSAMGC